MSKFKPGDKVICIKDHPDNIFGLYQIKKGTELTVRSVFDNPGYTYKHVRFEGLILPTHPTVGEEYGYDPGYFEPLISTTQQFVEVTYTKIIETAPKTCAS